MDSIKFPSKSVLGEHGRLVSGNAVKNAIFSAFGDPSAILTLGILAFFARSSRGE